MTAPLTCTTNLDRALAYTADEANAEMASLRHGVSLIRLALVGTGDGIRLYVCSDLFSGADIVEVQS